MYWQKRFDRENPDKQLEDEITKIHIENKDYGYRRVYRELRNRKIFVNKKKVQRIMQKLCFQVTSFTRKSRRYNSYKGNVGKMRGIFSFSLRLLGKGRRWYIGIH